MCAALSFVYLLQFWHFSFVHTVYFIKSVKNESVSHEWVCIVFVPIQLCVRLKEFQQTKSFYLNFACVCVLFTDSTDAALLKQKVFIKMHL